ncbi:hypothetical protein GUJ93_ZPchr1338g33756, partial [Zizania palustris]
ADSTTSASRRADWIFIVSTVFVQPNSSQGAIVRMDQIYMAAVNNQTSMSDDEPQSRWLLFVAISTAGLASMNGCAQGLNLLPVTNSSLTRRQCPVCKAALSPDMVVPLYGRGGSLKKSLNDLAIPRRPTMHRETFEHQNPQNINDQHHEQNMEEPSPPLQPLRHSGHHSSATEFDFIYPPSAPPQCIRLDHLQFVQRYGCTDSLIHLQNEKNHGVTCANSVAVPVQKQNGESKNKEEKQEEGSTATVALDRLG